MKQLKRIGKIHIAMECEKEIEESCRLQRLKYKKGRTNKDGYTLYEIEYREVAQFFCLGNTLSNLIRRYNS